MGNWITFGTDWFKLEDFCHIWIQTRYYHEKDTRTYYLMGEWKHNAEEVILSKEWESVEDLTDFTNEKLGVLYKVKNTSPYGNLF